MKSFMEKGLFFLNPYEQFAFTKCPKCSEKTKVRKIPLVIDFEPSVIFVLNIECKYCPSCDLVIGKKYKIELALKKFLDNLDPEIVSNEYFVVGTLDKSDWRKTFSDKYNQDQILKKLRLFKEVMNFEMIPGGWYKKGEHPAEKKQKKRSRSTNDKVVVYELEITLLNTNPRIWRRFSVPGDMDLERLHRTIQAVMGWENEHLYMFKIGNQEYADDEMALELGDRVHSAYAQRISDVLNRKGQKFLYEYDFGDSWMHQIKVVKIEKVSKEKMHPICLAGERACPPEDVGGSWGYENFLEAIGDATHGEHKDMMDWVGGSFDPVHFDINPINEQLKRI